MYRLSSRDFLWFAAYFGCALLVFYKDKSIFTSSLSISIIFTIEFKKDTKFVERIKIFRIILKENNLGHWILG